MNTQIKLKKIHAALHKLEDSLKRCAICPRRCGVDRSAGSTGYCRAPFNPVVYSHLAHHGEEPALSGSKGSGAIFFTHCNMKCVYCQNYYFSQLDNGAALSAEKLAFIMLNLQKAGCHNINLVNPTHFVPQILMALELAIEKGLNVPIVYNTSGYDSLETIKLLDGIVDIYLPDMRYSDNEKAKIYSDASDYVECNKASVKEMQAQVGDLTMDDEAIAKKGLIIRLLILPNDISGTARILRFIKENVSPNAYISIMSQFYPTFKAYNFKEMSRGVTKDEYKIKVDEARQLGLNNGWVQEAPERTNEIFLGTNIKPKNYIS